MKLPQRQTKSECDTVLYCQYLMQSDSSGVFSDSSAASMLLQSSSGSDMVSDQSLLLTIWSVFVSPVYPVTGKFLITFIVCRF